MGHAQPTLGTAGNEKMYQLTTCRSELSTQSSPAVHQEAGTTGSQLRLRMFWSEQTLLGLIQNQPTETLANCYYKDFGIK